MSTTPTASSQGDAPPVRRDRTHYLYIAVIAAVVLGAVVGLVFPDFAVGLKWIGTTFVALIKMMIARAIFCTVVHGIASAGDLKKVGRVGVKSIVYFEVVTTIALILGIVVAYVVGPGADAGRLADDVRSACERALARFKVPTRVEVVDALPVGITGKVQKGRLRGLERRRALGLLE